MPVTSIEQSASTAYNFYLTASLLFQISFSDHFATVFGRPFVKRFALCYQTVVCLYCLLTFVYCGQTVGRITMKLGMQVGLC